MCVITDMHLFYFNIFRRRTVRHENSSEDEFTEFQQPSKQTKRFSGNCNSIASYPEPPVQRQMAEQFNRQGSPRMEVFPSYCDPLPTTIFASTTDILQLGSNICHNMQAGLIFRLMKHDCAISILNIHILLCNS